MNFEKELNEIVENRVDVIKKQSKAKSIAEFVKDEATIARLNRIYDTKDVLVELYDMYEEDTVFAEVYDIDNYYIEYYNSGDDDWLVWINDALDQDFPLQQVNE